MTDSNQAPNQSPNSSPGYEGTDPDLPDRRDAENTSSRTGVSTVQVGASAAAAVTSALAASFFGVAGTLIGAALGSIVSTIAGALYADYLGRAGQRIKETRSVVIQRIPGEVLATTPLRHLTRPTDLPGQQSMQLVGDEGGAETVDVPVQDAEQLRRHPDGLAPLHPSRSPSQSRPLWKRPLVALSAVSAAGFLIALGVVLATELFLGHPVSGGDSGTTLSNLGNTSSNSDVKPTETETPSVSPSAAVTEAPVPTPSTDVATSAPAVPTGRPTVEATDPGSAATDPAAAETDSGAAGSDAQVPATAAP